jgi:hypothetical protein
VPSSAIFVLSTPSSGNQHPPLLANGYATERAPGHHAKRPYDNPRYQSQTTDQQPEGARPSVLHRSSIFSSPAVSRTSLMTSLRKALALADGAALGTGAA